MKINKSQITKTTLRALTASIPVIGGAALEMVFEHRSRLKSERVFQFLENLKLYFEEVSESKINTEFINSNEFADIFEEIINKVAKTEDERKKERFKQLLIGTTIPNAKVYQFEIFLELTSKLHENQIILLKKFYQAKPKIQNLEKQISQLQDELKKSKAKEDSLKIKAEEGTIKPSESITKEIEKSRSIEQNKILRENEIKKLMAISREDLFKVSDIDMNIFVDDLLAKRLLLDVSEVQHGEKSNSYERMVISPMGHHYIEFLKGE
jgi:hypothetical protein